MGEFSDDMTDIIAAMETAGLGKVTVVTVKAKTGAKTTLGAPTYTTATSGTPVKWVILPIGVVREEFADRFVETATHVGFAPDGVAVSPLDLAEDADGDEYTCGEVQTYDGHHVEVNLRRRE